MGEASQRPLREKRDDVESKLTGIVWWHQSPLASASCQVWLFGKEG
jgi:hypothetical protein